MRSTERSQGQKILHYEGKEGVPGMRANLGDNNRGKKPSEGLEVRKEQMQDKSRRYLVEDD